MFANLFRPKWRHSDPDVRASAVDKLRPDHPEQASILRQLALSDSSRKVRLTAVRRLSDTASLLTVLQQSEDAEIRVQAGIRVGECLNGDDSAGTLCQLLEQIDDPRARSQIIINTSSTQLQATSLNGIGDEAELMQIALHARLASIRKAAVQRIENAELLEQLQRASRGRDKAVHRISREKLGQLREQARRQAEAEQRRQRLLDQLQQLADSRDTQFLHARAQALYQDWQQLAVTDAAARARFDQLRTRIDQRLQQQADAEAEAARRQQQQQRNQALAEQLLAQLTQYGQQPDAEATPALTELSRQVQTLAGELPPPLQQTLTQALERAETLAAAHQRLAQRQATVAALLAPAETTADQQLQQARRLLAEIAWPDAHPAPSAIHALQQQIDRLQQACSMQQQAAQQLRAELNARLDQLAQAIEDGNLSEADQLHGQLTCQLPLSGATLTDEQETRFRLLQGRLNELRDWQVFAAAGKKEALCAQMEALIGAELPPATLAERIKALQQEWKQVDATDPIHSQKLWKRFQEAGEQAYAPCQAWFSAQRQQREFNLQQRQQICRQLQTYLDEMDWSQADWPAVEAVSRTAREEWRRFAPVDRAPGKPLQQTFNTLLRELDQHIKAHRQRCADSKEQLIARAAELTCAEDPVAAADEARRLQQQWKAVGPTFRSRERALWQQFRSHCDQIFGRLKQSRRQPPAPPAAAEASPAAIDSAALAALQQLAALAEQTEQELVSEGRSSTLSSLLTAAITGPSPGAYWRERIGRRLEAIRLLSAGTRSLEQQLALSERQARELCIRLEILLGVPSPEQDEALRMEYQMERLNQVLAQQDQAPTPAALQALALEWLTLPLGWQFDALQQRFDRLLPTD